MTCNKYRHGLENVRIITAIITTATNIVGLLQTAVPLWYFPRSRPPKQQHSELFSNTNLQFGRDRLQLYWQNNIYTTSSLSKESHRQYLYQTQRSKNRVAEYLPRNIFIEVSRYICVLVLFFCCCCLIGMALTIFILATARCKRLRKMPDKRLGRTTSRLAQWSPHIKHSFPLGLVLHMEVMWGYGSVGPTACSCPSLYHIGILRICGTNTTAHGIVKIPRFQQKYKLLVKLLLNLNKIVADL